MEFQKVYFLGIGGIGMSALARYFLHEGKKVAGYDRTPSHLTDELSAEGAAIHFEDDVRLIPSEFLDPAATMVVYTPAVRRSTASTAISPATGSVSRSARRCWGTSPKAST